RRRPSTSAIRSRAQAHRLARARRRCAVRSSSSRTARSCASGRASDGSPRVRMRFIYNTQLFVYALVLSGVSFAQAPPPAGFPGKPPEGPPAEIVRFEAAPAAIDPGQSVTLRWDALNAFSLSIAPGIGAVATRGKRTLAPSATTTYTLTVTGSGGTKTAST